MQEEVESKTVHLAITTGRLTWQAIFRGFTAWQYNQTRSGGQSVQGKQSVKDLIGQNAGVSTIPISKTDLNGFERTLKKYGIDYAITRDNSSSPPHYTVFFKSRDADALTAAFKEYNRKKAKQQARPSVRKTLEKLIEKTAAIPKKVIEKVKEYVR